MRWWSETAPSFTMTIGGFADPAIPCRLPMLVFVDMGDLSMDIRPFEGLATRTSRTAETDCGP